MPARWSVKIGVETMQVFQRPDLRARPWLESTGTGAGPLVANPQSFIEAAYRGRSPRGRARGDIGTRTRPDITVVTRSIEYSHSVTYLRAARPLCVTVEATPLHLQVRRFAPHRYRVQSPPDLPRGIAACPQRFETDFVAHGVHALPKAVVLVGHQLALARQALQGLALELGGIAVDVVEYARL